MLGIVPKSICARDMKHICCGFRKYDPNISVTDVALVFIKNIWGGTPHAPFANKVLEWCHAEFRICCHVALVALSAATSRANHDDDRVVPLINIPYHIVVPLVLESFREDDREYLIAHAVDVLH
jgi:hypothetical protein